MAATVAAVVLALVSGRQGKVLNSASGLATRLPLLASLGVVLALLYEARAAIAGAPQDQLTSLVLLMHGMWMAKLGLGLLGSNVAALALGCATSAGEPQAGGSRRAPSAWLVLGLLAAALWLWGWFKLDGSWEIPSLSAALVLLSGAAMVGFRGGPRTGSGEQAGAGTPRPASLASSQIALAPLSGLAGLYLLQAAGEAQRLTLAAQASQIALFGHHLEVRGYLALAAVAVVVVGYALLAWTLRRADPAARAQMLRPAPAVALVNLLTFAATAGLVLLCWQQSRALSNLASGPARLLLSTGVNLGTSGSQLVCDLNEPIVVATRKAVQFVGSSPPGSEGTRTITMVGELQDGFFPVTAKRDGVDGYFVTQLHALLSRQAEREKQDAAENPARVFKGIILLALDEDLPYRTVSEIMYSAGQAEYGNFKLLRRSTDAPPSFGLVHGLPLLAGTDPGPVCVNIAAPSIGGVAPVGTFPVEKLTAGSSMQAGPDTGGPASATVGHEKAGIVRKVAGKGLLALLASPSKFGIEEPRATVFGDLSVVIAGATSTAVAAGASPGTIHAAGHPPIKRAQVRDPVFMKNLVQKLTQLKAEAPGRTLIELQASRDLTFGDVTTLQDATRTAPDGGELFPDVVVSNAPEN
ncbi:MAG: hypothetical protein ABIJ09_12210 [Pseudomonadota bacterium]